MPLIPFPSVPQVPGVPVLLRSLTVPTPGALFNVAASGLASTLFGTITWAVLSADGQKVLNPDSFVGIDYSNSGEVSNYPMEAGAFSSYNKVSNPYDCSVTMTIGADKAARTSFLAKLEQLVQGLDLLSVVTPEVTYINANLKRYDYKRTAQNGLSLITAQLYFTQVRQTAKSTVRDTADPSGAINISGGQIQLIEPTDDQIAAAGAIA